jgi:hypothetical protein
MNKTIFLLEKTISEKEISNLIKNHENLKIFSLDYESHQFLENLGIVHVVGDSLLTDDILQKIDEHTIQTTENWHKNKLLQNHFTLNDVLLPSLLEQEFLIYFKEIFIILFTILEIINKNNPTKIFSSSLMNNFIEKYCKSKNIEVQILEQNISSSLFHEKINIKFNILKIPISFKITRKNYYKLLKFKKFIDSALNFSSTHIDKSKKSILLLNFDVSNYEELLMELSKFDINILLLNLRKPATSNINEIKIVKRSQCSIIDLEKYKNDIFKKITREKDRFRENLEKIWDNDEYFQSVFSINNTIFWGSIKKSFTQICASRFDESIERILLIDEFFNKNKISSLLEWAEVGQEEQECLHISKKFRITTIMLQHGKYLISKKWDPFAKFLAQFPSLFLSDKQAVWGNFTKNYAMEYNHSENNLIVTGSPRHDKFFNFSKNQIKSNTILLATTGPFDTSADTSTVSARIHYENFVKKICEEISKIPNKKLMIKPHPSSKYTQDTLNLLKKINVPFEIVLDSNLPELINKTELVITFNNSTIALESIIMDVPVISIQTGKWAEDDEIVKMNAVRSVTKLENVKQEIHNVLFDSSTKKSLHENGLKFLESYMAYQGKSSKKLAQIMNDF